MKNILKQFIILFLLFIIIAGFLSTTQSPTSKPQGEATIKTLLEKIGKEEVQSIVVENNTLKVTTKIGDLLKIEKEPSEPLSSLLSNYGVSPSLLKDVDIQVKAPSRANFIVTNILPIFLPLIVIGGFIFFMMRQIGGANSKAMTFGQSRAREINLQKDNKKNGKKENLFTFENVAGSKEAKEELQEIVEFLRNPKKFTDIGARIPKGAILVGPPGTGKTMLARAVSGEANVPFFHISGSEFVEMFVGVGASRVRSLFGKAKKNAPCIVFIDEIDAVGRQRGAGIGGSHDEREQTLNQILVEMDGFETDTQVIVMAATNRPDVLDRALLRPGRFDRRITIDLPDINEREEILTVHAKNVPLQKDTKLRLIAQRTPGFSGADLSNLVNEAAIFAARKDKKVISMDELIPSIEKVLLGPERKSHILSDKEKKITAYHEAGHALVAHILPNADPVHKVSIISRGNAGGYTLNLPSEDRNLHSRAEFIDDLAVFLGGYAAEKLIFNSLTTGASSDLKRATNLAKKIVTEYGMSDLLGPRTFGEREELIFLGREISETKDYSEEFSVLIDKEISKLLNSALETATETLHNQEKKLHAIATVLLEKETIEKEAFEHIMSEGVSQEDDPSTAQV